MEAEVSGPAIREQITTLLDQATVLLTTYGLNVLGAIALLIVGFIVAGIVRRGVRRGLTRAGWVDGTIRPLVVSCAYYGVVVITVVAVLNQFGIQTASIIAVLGAGMVAIGLALQGTLSQIAAGLMLLVLRPFQVGDYIDAGGAGGTVSEIGLFRTELHTADNVYVSVPNSDIFSNRITNYSRLDRRRLDIAVGVGYGSDLDVVFALLHGVAEGDGRVLTEPAPEVMVAELADSAVTVQLRIWTMSADHWAVKWDLTREAKETLDAHGIEIPFPQQVVTLERGAAPA